jgi:hypothetical protein
MRLGTAAQKTTGPSLLTPIPGSLLGAPNGAADCEYGFLGYLTMHLCW